MISNERFWSHVEKKGENECWNWIGNKNASGYGRIVVRYGSRKVGKRKFIAAHRHAYKITNGEIPDGMMIRHSCNNRACCNPNHLSIGTHQDNMTDMVLAGRSTYGERNPTSKLTACEVEQIRLSRKNGYTLKELGRIYNVSLSNIHLICKGKSWSSNSTK